MTTRELRLAVVLAVVCTAKANATLTIFDASLSPVTRVTGFPDAVYGVGVDSSGDVYWSTGTAPSGYNGRIMTVDTAGTVTTLTPAVNTIIGTRANLEIGFGGNLFANSGAPGQPATQGVAEFAIPGGAPSMFYHNTNSAGDAGLAFDATNQVMYVDTTAAAGIFAINSAGTGTLVATPSEAGGYGLALENDGTLLLMGGNGHVFHVDPVAHTSTPVVDLSVPIPNWSNFSALDIDPSTGQAYFVVLLNTGSNELYRMNANGTGLTPVALSDTTDNYGTFLGMKIGASGDGSGHESIYLGFNGNLSGIDGKIVELRPVPEPSTMGLFLAGFALLAFYRVRFQRAR